VEDECGQIISQYYEDYSGLAPSSTKSFIEIWDTNGLTGNYYLIKGLVYYNGKTSNLMTIKVYNWSAAELEPIVPPANNKAGRSFPIKFSVSISDEVDPTKPFVNSQGLEIKIYQAGSQEPLQVSRYGDKSNEYRIDVQDEIYITNFKTAKESSEYIVEVWQLSPALILGSFTFETTR
jgi:hypothetical protein